MALGQVSNPKTMRLSHDLTAPAPAIEIAANTGLDAAAAQSGGFKSTTTNHLKPPVSAAAEDSASPSTVVADFGSRLHAGARIQPDFLGVGLGGNLVRSLLAPVTQAGLRYTRFHADIQDTFNGGAPNWTALDANLRALQAAGMHAILEVDGTPASLQPSRNPCPAGTEAWHAAPADLTAFAQMAAAYVRHIDQNFPGVVQDYEIWNEPDGGGLCAPGNTQQAKLRAYLAIYAALAPALRHAAEQDGVTIRIGGPTLGSPVADAPVWIPALLSNAATAPYVDFVSFHYYIASAADVSHGLSWNGGATAPSLLAKTQDAKYGLAAIYEKVANLVHQGVQPHAADTPIYFDEYNENWSFVNDCCRNDATFAPVWNALAIVDILNSVGAGAPELPARMMYYAISNHPFCLVGKWDEQMDCVYPYSSPASAQPYPQYYAYELFASPAYLNINGGGYLASSASSANGNLHVAAFYTAEADTIVLVNTSASDYANVGVQWDHPGLSGAQATVYTLNSSNRAIATESVALSQAGAGLHATVTVPRYAVVAVSAPVGGDSQP